MNEADQQSTSSDEAERSKEWPEVVRLGQRIVRELGLAQEFDVLGRWMAHRVAELMDRADNANSVEDRELAEKECTDVIVRLWQQRASRSRARPLSEIASFLEEFVDKKAQYLDHPPQVGEATWLGSLPRLQYIQQREEEILYAAALVAVPLETEQEWLADFPNELSEDEKKVIHNWVWLKEHLVPEYFGSINHDASSLEQYTEQALRLLDEHSAERQLLLDALRVSGGYSDNEQVEYDDQLDEESNQAG